MRISKSAGYRCFLITSILCVLVVSIFTNDSETINIFKGIIYVISGLILGYLFKQYYDDWLNPATILSVAWLCFFGLNYFGDIIEHHDFNFIYIYPIPSVRTALVVLLSYILFILGIVMVSNIKPVEQSGEFIYKKFVRTVNIKILKFTIIFLFIVGFSFYIYCANMNNWIIPILAALPRGRVGLPVLGYFIMLLKVVPVLGVIYCFILYRSHGQISTFIIFLSFFSFATLFSNVQRVDIMTSVLMISLALYYLNNKKIKAFSLVLLILLLFTVFYGILYARATFLGFNRNYLLDTYNDTGAAFRNLSVIIETQSPSYKPIETIRFLDTFYDHSLSRIAVEKQLFIFKGYGLVSTYLGSVYLDFGILGCIIVPFVIGFTTGLGYKYMRMKPNIFSFYLYAILAVGVFATYRQFKFTGTTEIIYYPVVGYLVYIFTRLKTKRQKKAV
jgi:oligosaccharide repeat unit polymerase